MIEHLFRVAGPAYIVVCETEAPTRIVSTASSHEEQRRLDLWVEESPAREAALGWASLDRAERGGRAREIAWLEQLRGDPGGVAAALEAVLRGDFRP